MMAISKRRIFGKVLPWLLLAVGVILVMKGTDNPGGLIDFGDQWALIGALAIVMTAIVLTGGIDLSVGSMVALSSVAIGVLWQQGWSLPVACGAAVVVGMLAGALNGTLVVIGLSPLVATLATMAFYSGLAMMLSGAEKITEFALGTAHLGGLPGEYWVLAMTFIVAVIIIHFTRFGRWCFVIGDNKLAATFAAVPVQRTQWLLYTACGLVAGVLAVIYTIRNGAIPDGQQGVELKAIACVVVGGSLITGGRGGIPFTLLGLAVLATVDMGLQFLSSNPHIRDYVKAEARLVVVGILLIAVAVWNQWTAREDETSVEENV